MEKPRTFTHQEFLSQRVNGGADFDKHTGTIVTDDPVPEPKKTNIKWKLSLEYMDIDQSVKLLLTKEESRQHVSTVRSLVSRYKKNNPPKNFAVRLIDNEEWTGIGIWRTDEHE